MRLGAPLLVYGQHWHVRPSATAMISRTKPAFWTALPSLPVSHRSRTQALRWPFSVPRKPEAACGPQITNGKTWPRDATPAQGPLVSAALTPKSGWTAATIPQARARPSATTGLAQHARRTDRGKCSTPKTSPGFGPCARGRALHRSLQYPLMRTRPVAAQTADHAHGPSGLNPA